MKLRFIVSPVVPPGQIIMVDPKTMDSALATMAQQPDDSIGKVIFCRDEEKALEMYRFGRLLGLEVEGPNDFR